MRGGIQIKGRTAIAFTNDPGRSKAAELSHEPTHLTSNCQGFTLIAVDTEQSTATAELGGGQGLKAAMLKTGRSS